MQQINPRPEAVEYQPRRMFNKPLGWLLSAALATSLTLGGAHRVSAGVAPQSDTLARVSPSSDGLAQLEGEIHPVCLIGEWHVVNLASYARSAIQVGTIENATGPYYWSFHQDGRFSQSADITVEATSSAGDRFVQRMLLVSSGNYRDSRDMVLTLDGVIATGNVDVTVNGEPFIQGADPTGLTASDGSRISYACDGDRLTIQPDFGDGRVALMNLQRYRS
ncbi:MAG: hypothetical protein ACKVVP_20950 [Chloroflexota bacterium]